MFWLWRKCGKIMFKITNFSTYTFVLVLKKYTNLINERHKEHTNLISLYFSYL